MFWKIEPSGCFDKVNKKGDLCLQIRYAFYLEQGDIGYEKRQVEEVILKESAKGKRLITADDVEKTGKIVNVPLHNHFIELPYNVSDAFINQIGNQLLQIVDRYNNLGYFENRQMIHIPNTIPRYDQPTEVKRTEAKIKLEYIKTNKEWLLT